MGERASNLFGVLLSLTFFSVLLAVMLVAVSILPDGARLAPPTLPGETESSRPVRTPQPVTIGGLALEPAPVLAPPGPALGQVNFATEAIPPPTAPETGGPTVGGPRGGRTGGPGGGIRTPGSATPDVPGKARGHVKKKGETDHPKRGRAFLRCDEQSATGKGKGRCDPPGKSRGNGHGGGRGKGGSSGSDVDAGGSSHGGNGHGLGHTKAKGNGQGGGHGHGKGHSKHGG